MIPRSVSPHGDRPVRSITVQVQQLPDSYVISAVQASGWSATARNPIELARALAVAFTEVDVASYARWKGQAYDLAQNPDRQARRPPGSRRSALGGGDSHDPSEWSKLDDGRWLSPGGRTFRADSQQVVKVVAKRRKLGLAC